MERMIQCQGEDHIFVGGRPKTAEQYSSRYKLARGVSAVHFASNRRTTSRARSSREPRVLNYDLPMSSILRKWWSRCSEQEHMNLAHVEVLLNDGFEAVPHEEAAEHSYRPSAAEGVPGESIGVRKRDTRKTGQGLRNKFLQTKSLTPSEFLLAFQWSQTQETPMLKFDYLALRRATA